MNHFSETARARGFAFFPAMLLALAFVCPWQPVKAAASEAPALIAVKDDDSTKLVERNIPIAWGDNDQGQTTVPLNITEAQAVASGGAHTMALLSDGTVRAWGGNDYGQATVPSGLSDVRAISAGFYHSMALRNNGTVVVWGRNDYAQANVPAATTAVGIAAGGDFCLALLADGTVRAWGRNDFGQTTVPSGLNNVVAVAAGAFHGVALKKDGTIVAWGNNAHGQTTVPTNAVTVKAIAAGSGHSVALRADGSVITWGLNDSGQTNTPGWLGDVRAVAAGDSHTVVLQNDGSVVAWGQNNFGQSTIPSVARKVRAISAGFYHTVALSGDLPKARDFPDETFGTASPVRNFSIENAGYGELTDIVVTVAGENMDDFAVERGAANVVAGGSSDSLRVRFSPSGVGRREAVISIASGSIDKNPFEFRVAGTGVMPEITLLDQGGNPLLKTERIVGWGDNSKGQLTLPTRLTGVKAVAAGGAHTVALKENGTVVAWGSDKMGQCSVPEGLTGVVAVGAGLYHTVALRSDGSVIAWGGNNFQQTNVPPAAMSGIVAIAVGSGHTLALKQDGTVVAWGDNSYGQATVPAGLSGVKTIAAGGYHSVAFTTSGQPFVWGDASSNQKVLPPAYVDWNPRQLSGGGAHTLVLTTDGAVAGWGAVGAGQLNIPGGLLSTDATRAVAALNPNVLTGPARAVAAGDSHSVALLADGTVAAWGDNRFGQASVPVGLSGVKAIAAGFYHTVALKEDGTVVAWGLNSFGQATVPQPLASVEAIAAGAFHTVALQKDGTALAWGANAAGQTAIAGEWRDIRKIAAGSWHTLGIRRNGLVVERGDNTWGQLLAPPDLTGAFTIAGGGFHSLAVRSDGQVAAWGADGVHQSAVPSQYAKAVAAGMYHSLALLEDGTVLGWGDNGSGEAAVPAGLSGVKAIAAGGFHSVALRTDGTVAAWGDNNYGQVNVPPGLRGVKAVAAGYVHTLALKDDGTVVAWGANLAHQADVPAGLRDVSAITAGFYHSLALVKEPPSIAFGTIPAGEISQPQYFKIKNSGLSALTINSVSISGADAAMFRVRPGIMTPIQVTGFNHDIVLEAGAVPAPFTYDGGYVPFATTASMDTGPANTGNSFFEMGYFFDYPGYGLPPAGSTLITAHDAGISFQMPPSYSANNALISGASQKAGTLTLSQPAAYSALSFLTASAAGNATVDVLVHFADGSAQKGRIVSPDWFGNEPVAFYARGRADVRGWNYGNNLRPRSIFSNMGEDNPRLYNVNLELDNHGSPVTRIDFQFVQGGNAAIFAVSGSAPSVPATLAPAAETKLALVFKASAAAPGARNAQLLISTDDPVHPVSELRLNGSGTVAGEPLLFAGAGIDLANQIEERSTSSFGELRSDGMLTRVFTLKNSGSAILSGIELRKEGAHPADFIVGPLARTSLEPNESETFTVAFAPKAAGVREAVVKLFHAGTVQSPFEIDVTGVSLPPEIHIAMAGRGDLQLKNRIVVWGAHGFEPSFGNFSFIMPVDPIRDVPSALTSAQDIQSTDRSMLALTGGGEVMTWSTAAGSANTLGLSNVVAIHGGWHNVTAYKADGTSESWPGPPTPPPADIIGLKTFSEGDKFTAGLKADGTVAVWGPQASSYQPPLSLTEVRDISAGGEHILALRQDGTIVSWGLDFGGAHPERIVPSGLVGVVAIAAGGKHSLALKSDGQVVAWGENSYGQLDVPANLGSVRAIAAGAFHSAALTGEVPVNFGACVIGSIAGPQTFSIKNRGLGPLVLKRIYLAGPDALDFELHTPSLPLEIAAAVDPTSISVAFKPLSSGRKKAFLRVVSNDLDNGFADVALTGTALAASKIEVFKDPLTFAENKIQPNGPPISIGRSARGGNSAIREFTIRNAGDDSLRNLSVAISGANAGDFTVTPLELTTLGLYSRTRFTIAFTPSAAGTRSAVVSIGSNDPDHNPFVFDITGERSMGPSLAALVDGQDLVADNRLIGWGDNSASLLTELTDLKGVKALASGQLYTLGVTDTGDVFCFGSVLDGSLGSSSFSGFPPGLSNVAQIGLGAALKNDGRVVTWNPIPEPAASLGPVKLISVGPDYVLALKPDGTVTAWGGNAYGQCNVPAGLNHVKGIAAGRYHAAAVLEDGTVVTWGQASGSVPYGLKNVVGINATSAATFALLQDRSVISWSIHGGAATTVGRDVLMLASDPSSEHIIAVKLNGTVEAWGPNFFGAGSVPAGLTDARYAATSLTGSLAVKNNGEIVTWGRNTYGQLTVPAALTSVREVSAGRAHVLAIRKDGRALAAGNLARNEVSGPLSVPDAQAVAAGDSQSLVVPTGGYMLQWNVSGNLRLASLSSIQGIRKLAGGLLNGVALTSDGRLYSDGYFGYYDRPFGLPGFNAIAANGSHALAVRDDGSVLAWGSVGSGTAFRAPSGIATVAALGLGPNHTLFALADGTVAGFGNNDFGQSAVPADLSNVTAVAAGDSHSVALRRDGTVAAWGRNSEGQASVPTDLQNVEAIAAAGNYTLALTRERIVRFGEQSTTYASQPKTITLQNRGLGLLNIRKVKLAGESPSAFAINTSGVGSSIDPGGSVSLSAVFHPVGAGKYRAAIQIESDDPDQGVYEIQLLGVGRVTPAISVLTGVAEATDDMGIYEIGATRVGGLGSSREFTFRNSGAGVLITSSLSVAGPESGDFTVEKRSADVLFPGDSGTFTVRFVPLSLGTRAATITLASADPNARPFRLHVSGVGLPGAKAEVYLGASVSPADRLPSGGPGFNFAATPVNSPGPSQVFTVKNTAAAPLTGLSLAMDGQNAGDFALTGPAERILAAGATTTFTVRFAPISGGYRYGKAILISDDAGEEPFELNLSGAAGAPAIALEQPAGTSLPVGEQFVVNYAVAPTITLNLAQYQQNESSSPPTVNQSVASTINDGQSMVGGATVLLTTNGTVRNLSASAIYAVPAAAMADVTQLVCGHQPYMPLPYSGADSATYLSWLRGGDHFLALKSDGTVVAWGNNTAGQCIVPAALPPIKAVAAGADSSMALTQDGRVISWGGSVTQPDAVLSNVRAIAASRATRAALRNDGSVIVWGDDGGGSLVPPSSATNIQALAMGDRFFLALKSDGTILAWGSNIYGECDVPAGLSGVAMVAAGFGHAAALKFDGTVVAWGQLKPSVPTTFGRAVAIAADEGFITTKVKIPPTVDFGNRLAGVDTVKEFAIRNNGVGPLILDEINVTGADVSSFTLDMTDAGGGIVPSGGGAVFRVIFNAATTGPKSALLRLTGRNGFLGEVFLAGNALPNPHMAVFAPEQLFNNTGVKELSPVPFGATGGAATFTVKNSGVSAMSGLLVAAEGFDSADFQVSSLPVTSLAPGDSANFSVTFKPQQPGHRSVLIKIASTDPDANPFVIQVAAEGLAPKINISQTSGESLDSDLYVTAWGDGFFGAAPAPPNLRNPSALAAGAYGSLMVDRDGRITAWGSTVSPPQNFPAVKTVVGGGGYGLAITREGHPIGFGNTDRYYVYPKLAASKIIAVDGSDDSILLVKEDHTLATLGPEGSRLRADGWGGLKAVAAGFYHGIGLGDDSTLVGWGQNDKGQLNIPAGLTNITAIASYGYHSLALKADGTVVAWGENFFGQCNVPAGLRDVQAIEAGNETSMALKRDGTVVTWGRTFDVPPPANLKFVKMIASGGRTFLAAFTQPSTVAFGRVSAGSVLIKSLTLRNTGTDNLQIGNIVKSGPEAADFEVVASLPTTLLPGESATVDVRFSPVAEGVKSALLEVKSNDPYSGNFEILLQGEAPSEPKMAVSLRRDGVLVDISNNASPVELPGIALGASRTNTYTVANRGLTPLKGLSATLLGLDASHFSMAALPTTTLAPNESLSFDLVFKPLAIGAREVEIQIASNDPNANPFRMVLRSSALLPTIELVQPSGEPFVLGARTAVVWGSSDGNWATPPPLNSPPISVSTSEYYSAIVTEDGQLNVYGRFIPPNMPSGIRDIRQVACGQEHVVALKNDGAVIGWGNGLYGLPPAGLKDVVAVEAGFYHYVALKKDGTVVVWGGTANGGDKDVPPSLNGVIAISAGYSYTLALKSDGTVVSWGVGLGVPDGLTDVVAISAGGSRYGPEYNHALAFKKDGTVVAWGNNSFQQTTVPPGLANVSLIAADFDSSFAVRKDGSVVSWGKNDRGQTSVPGAIRGFRQIAPSDTFTLGIVEAPSQYDFGTQVSGVPTAPRQFTIRNSGTAILRVEDITVEGSDAPFFRLELGGFSNEIPPGGSATFAMTFATTGLGKKSAVLRIAHNDLKRGPIEVMLGATAIAPQKLVASESATQLFDASSISWAPAPVGASSNKIVTFRNSGAAVLSGIQATIKGSDRGDFRVSSPVLTTLAGGAATTFTITFTPGAAGARNAVMEILSNDPATNSFTVNLAGVGTAPRMAVHVPASQPATRPARRVIGWGGNQFKQADAMPWDDVQSVAAGAFHNVALRNDGVVVAWGWNDLGQTNVPTGLRPAKAVAAGDFHSLALETGGLVVAWGRNKSGQTNVPNSLVDAKAIAAGGSFSAALRNDGAVVIWGANLGELNPPELTGIAQLAAGHDFVAALKTNGKVVVFGIGDASPPAVPSGLADVRSISAGYAHVVALKNDGTVVSWGDNQFGQSAVPADLINVRSIVAGHWHTLALKTNGELIAWGKNEEHQTVIPSGISSTILSLAAGAGHSVALIEERSELQFSSQVVRTTGAPGTVRLTNEGDAILNLSGITLSGADAADFILNTNALPATFQPYSAPNEIANSGISVSSGLTLREVGGSLAPGNLAPSGVAFSKDIIAGGAIAAHQTAFINDGIYGNARSWIGDSANSFVGIAFSSPQTIGRIAFGRDNTGAFGDRSAGHYVVQYTTAQNPGAATAAESWKTLGELTLDGTGNSARRHLYEFSPVSATGLRIITADLGSAIDELEVYAPVGMLSVQFKPESVGEKRANLTISGNDPNYPSVTIELRGRALPQQTPVLTWNDSSDIVYGTPLGTNQLNAVADVPGSFSYTPAAGTRLRPGATQTLSVTFTPADSVAYTTATRAVKVNVRKAPLTIALENKSKAYGAPMPALTAAYSGFVGDDNQASLIPPPQLTTTATAASAAGVYVVTASGSSLWDYEASVVEGQLLITQLPLAVSGIISSNKVYDGSTAATLNLSRAALVGVLTGDTVTLATTGAVGAFGDSRVGAGKPVTISGLALTGASSSNYTITQPTARASILPLDVRASGVAFDGYIGGASVFFDVNKNGILDDGEPRDITDQTGRFGNLIVSVDTYDLNQNGSLDPWEGTLVVVGGTDIATGFPLDTALSAPWGFKVINPLTTLVSELASSSAGNSVGDATSKVIAALGLTPGLDLSTYNPYTASPNSNSVPVAKASAQVHILAKSITSLLSGSLVSSTRIDLAKSVMRSLVAEIKASPNALTNLENAQLLQHLILETQSLNDLQTNGVSNTELVAAAANILAQVNHAMDDVLHRGGSIAEIAQVQVAAEGNISAALELVGQGKMDPQEAVRLSTGEPLSATINASPVGDLYGSGEIQIRIMISTSATGIVLDWGAEPGRLQQAESINGPWQTVNENSTSPYSIKPDTAARFYRVLR